MCNMTSECAAPLMCIYYKNKFDIFASKRQEEKEKKNLHYVEASIVGLGLELGVGLDGHEVSGVRKGDFRFPFRTVNSSLGLNVRGTNPSVSATSTIHKGPGKIMRNESLNHQIIRPHH